MVLDNIENTDKADFKKETLNTFKSIKQIY